MGKIRVSWARTMAAHVYPDLVRSSRRRNVGVAAPLDTDYYVLDELLMDEESEVRNRVRAFAVASSSRLPTSTVTRHSWLPFELVPKLAGLGLAGGTAKG